jgi:arginine utilization protein RocB
MSRVDNDEQGMSIALRSVRLQMLQRAYEQAERQGNILLGALLLEQAAKEMGRQPAEQLEPCEVDMQLGAELTFCIEVDSSNR